MINFKRRRIVQLRRGGVNCFAGVDSRIHSTRSSRRKEAHLNENGDQSLLTSTATILEPALISLPYRESSLVGGLPEGRYWSRMSDFFQTGAIATLHRLGKTDLMRL